MSSNNFKREDILNIQSLHGVFEIDADMYYSADNERDVYGCRTTRELAKLVSRFYPKTEKDIVKVLTSELEDEVLYLLNSNGSFNDQNTYKSSPVFARLVEEVVEFSNI